MDYDYLNLNINYSDMYESTVKEMYWHCKIFGSEDTDSNIEVGAIEVVILDEDWLTDGRTLHQYATSEHYDNRIEWAFNSVNYQNELDPYSKNDFNSLILNGIKNDTTHLGPEGKVQIHGRVAYIDTFKINKPYRNNRLGSKAMSDLIDFLSKLYVDFALIKPFPLECEGVSSKEGIKKLTTFYKRFGFEITDEYIDIDKDEQPHMFIEISQPEIVQLTAEDLE